MMSPELSATLTLAAYGALIVLCVVWQARRCTEGWQVWLLYVIDRLYCSLWFHWRSNRRCPFPPDSAAIIVANHRSPVDPLLIWMNHHLGEKTGPIRTISFMMAREYYNQPVVHWVSRNSRAIPVDRENSEAGPVRVAVRTLREDRWLGLFPEGRINTGEGLLPGNPGVAWLALRSRAPVYPVFIHNSPQGDHMVEPFFRKARVRVSYGDPIDLCRYYDRRIDDGLLREVTDLIMSRLAETGGISCAACGTETLPAPRRGARESLQNC